MDTAFDHTCFSALLRITLFKNTFFFLFYSALYWVSSFSIHCAKVIFYTSFSIFVAGSGLKVLRVREYAVQNWLLAQWMATRDIRIITPHLALRFIVFREEMGKENFNLPEKIIGLLLQQPQLCEVDTSSQVNRFRGHKNTNASSREKAKQFVEVVEISISLDEEKLDIADLKIFCYVDTLDCWSVESVEVSLHPSRGRPSTISFVIAMEWLFIGGQLARLCE